MLSFMFSGKLCTTSCSDGGPAKFLGVGSMSNRLISTARDSAYLFGTVMVAGQPRARGFHSGIGAVVTIAGLPELGGDR